MVKKALGKGLGALIPNREIFEKKEIFQEKKHVLPIHLIRPNPNQPRKIFSEVELKELSDSIRIHGILQPIVVRKIDDLNYELIAGERRFRAAQLAGLKEIPVTVKEADTRKSFELALVENLQRQNLGVMEEAKAYHSLIEEYDITQDILADTIGKNRVTIANTLRLLQLPDDVQKMIEENKISAGHAKVLLGLKNPAQQRSAAQEIIKKSLSVRQTEQWLERLLKTNIKSKHSSEDPVYKALTVSLEEQLGTHVRLIRKGKGGRIEIDFYSEDDLERLLNKMQLSLEAIS